MSLKYPEDASSNKVYEYSIIACGFSIALVSGIPNTIQNIFGTDLEDDLGISASDVSVLSALSLLGMYFTIPAGLLIDKFGPFHVTVCGSIFSTVGILLTSLAEKDTSGLTYFSVILIGFGSGAAFIAAMQASMSIASQYAGTAISIVGGGLSLSMSFIILVRIVYNEAAGCSGAGCWREHFYSLIGLSFLLMVIPSLAFKNAPRPQNVESQITDSASTESSTIDRHLSLSESVEIIKHPFFWALFIGYFTSIGTGLLILTQISNMWVDFDTSGDDWSEIISLFYSLSTFFGGILCGIVSDKMKDRDPLRTWVLSGFILFSVVNVLGISLLLLFPSSNDGLRVLFSIFIVNVALSFGSYFTLYPVIVGEVYGHSNFGKYFGYLQLASSSASVVMPIVGEQVETSQGDIVPLLFPIAALNVLSVLAINFLYTPYANTYVRMKT